ncbi:MAG: thioredoxin domain-containing protein [Chitinophagaceae bacterium]|nr:thioredoxin domain-containing protein [Chitinophagaceae bacterium]
MANQLISEQSPYLQQHAHNPVEWLPWGEAAFEQARKEHKPLIVSIGYSACHWCHVMEHESFEDPDTAAFMNAHFVNVKVDREEYPDVDDFYMTAVQALTGSGGWPLNVFVTPDKLPFYGGTYFPPVPAHGRPSWMQLMQRMADVWRDKPEDIQQQADQMLGYLENAAAVTSKEATEDWTAEDVLAAADQLLKQADTVHGGFGRAPKFPSAMSVSFLLEYAHFTGNKDALRHALLSLDKMIAGGIYDQVGGGFSRYSVDDVWLAPHFEKMLYDNALLVSVLCDAYQLTGKEEYREVLEDTIGFLLREMKQEGAGFYSALDADSEGVEGKFYTWTIDEWNRLMDQEDPFLADYFGVLKEGNWEHTNILHRAMSIEQVCAVQNRPFAAVKSAIRSASEKLFRERSKRVRPGTDDKILLSWNALLNTALCKASAVLQRPDYASLAQEHMDWMIGAFDIRNHPKHTWKNGVAKIVANLDDLANLAQAMIQLSLTLNDKRYLGEASDLVRYIEAQFSTPGQDLFYFTSSLQNEVPVRKPEIYDGVTPSSNAVMAFNLQALGLLENNSLLIQRSETLLRKMKSAAVRYTGSFAFWNTLGQRFVHGYKTITVAGSDTAAVAEELRKKFLPHCFYFFEKKENFVTMPIGNQFEKKAQIFICTKDACFPPLTEIPENIDFAIL